MQIRALLDSNPIEIRPLRDDLKVAILIVVGFFICIFTTFRNAVYKLKKQGVIKRVEWGVVQAPFNVVKIRIGVGGDKEKFSLNWC